jgi:hypothetical protein
VKAVVESEFLCCSLRGAVVSADAGEFERSRSKASQERLAARRRGIATLSTAGRSWRSMRT